jgi:hypothetical protein
MVSSTDFGNSLNKMAMRAAHPAATPHPTESSFRHEKVAIWSAVSFRHQVDDAYNKLSQPSSTSAMGALRKASSAQPSVSPSTRGDIIDAV